MARQQSALISGWDELGELVAIIGNERETRRLLFVWTNMAALFSDEAEDFFTGPDPETNAEALARMRAAMDHISALAELLDRRMAWLVSVKSPGFHEGTEVAEATEGRLADIVATLQSLRADIHRATEAIQVRNGRQLRPTPPLMLLLTLTSNLQELGVPFSAGENSKMVRAVRLFWQAAGLDGDPRDTLRTLGKRRRQVKDGPRAGA